MKLITLNIVNFRQFYGAHAIEFACDGSLNVTIIHGANAAGKTALLNIFRWCLYGKSILPSPDKIVSNRLIVESTISATLTVSAALAFEHEGDTYYLERSRKFRKFSELKVDPIGASELKLASTGADGQSKTIDNPQDKIRQILPEDIHPYFFFDGEDITSLADAEGKIKDGIRNLMSITVIERGVRHLEGCVARFRRECSEHTSEEAQGLDKRISELEDALQELDGTESNTQKQIGDIQKEKQLLSDQLKKLEPAKDFQFEREKLELRATALANDLAGIQNKLKQLIRSHGALPFLHSAVEEVRGIIEDKREKGNLPAGIKDNFVRDLLSRKLCICSRTLEDGPAREAVERFLCNGAVSAAVENTIQTLAGKLGGIDNDINDLFRGIEDLLSTRHGFEEEKQINNLRLSEIASELKGKDDVKEIAKIENRRSEIEREIQQATLKLGSIQANRVNKRDEITQLRRRLILLSDKAQKAEAAKKRFLYCEEAKNVFQAIYDILIEEARKSVAEKINGVLSRVTGNDFYVELTKEFQLRTLQRIGDFIGEIDKSTGQKQITSLAFIGALVDILREKNDRNHAGSFLRGGEYPIVMDSPFGSLDNIYGPRIARLAANVAPQVIVMVSGKQWLGGIADALYPNIGKQYVLVKNKPIPTTEDLIESKFVFGRTEIQAVKESDKYEFTTIIEVQHE